jgi:streptomycin 6-kinase
MKPRLLNASTAFSTRSLYRSCAYVRLKLLQFASENAVTAGDIHLTPILDRQNATAHRTEFLNSIHSPPKDAR